MKNQNRAEMQPWMAVCVVVRYSSNVTRLRHRERARARAHVVPDGACRRCDSVWQSTQAPRLHTKLGHSSQAECVRCASRVFINKNGMQSLAGAGQACLCRLLMIHRHTHGQGHCAACTARAKHITHNTASSNAIPMAACFCREWCDCTIIFTGIFTTYTINAYTYLHFCYAHVHQNTHAHAQWQYEQKIQNFHTWRQYSGFFTF